MSAAAQVPDVQLHVGPLDPDERVEAMGLAPLEPAAKLVRVQAVCVTRVPGQVGDGRHWAGVIESGWNGSSVVFDMASSAAI